ncbi:TetR family transcriptional regulator [Herbiconiux sp. CPCC 203407]|uniref:TetR family transcriptional regulator n=1 Tax=Herbiconiux oxytropis TaxID=2970915 RepID=A0AA42BTQ0_9MICO|nr:TetR family transcriptional regulator [Herbiconiux oxytropis]MCS5721708.1 TetR family transcriptional regulator [Herbiconiux oxytropis]MCS5726665.1 TetR family transcriptional regulator [Herbiconiux oxytropis]
MAWDVAGTKRKILDAAAREFTQRGPDGTTMERIAKLAGVNKERVYNYFGGKHELFEIVLREKLAIIAEAIPVDSFTPEGIGEYAGKLFDYNYEHPDLVRLVLWEALSFPADVPEEQQRRDYYAGKTNSFGEAQTSGDLSAALPPEHLNFLLLALAGYWSVLPQVARMMTNDQSVAEVARRRASVVEAARRLAATP